MTSRKQCQSYLQKSMIFLHSDELYKWDHARTLLHCVVTFTCFVHGYINLHTLRVQLFAICIV